MAIQGLRGAATAQRNGDSAILEGYSDANVAELVDAPDLGSGGATRASSSLAFRTKHWSPLLTLKLNHED
jgi:hypothetical protein